MNQKKLPNTDEEKKPQEKMVKSGQVFKVISFALQGTGFKISERVMPDKETGVRNRYFSLHGAGFTMEHCMACPEKGIIPLTDIENELQKAVNKFADHLSKQEGDATVSERRDEDPSSGKQTKSAAKNKKSSKS